MKKILFTLLALLIGMHTAFAASNEDLLKIIKAYYPLAEQHEGLKNEQDNVDEKKIKTYVVVMNEGIPASFPRRYISWQEHLYAGSLVKNGKIKPLRGQAFFRTLHPGEIFMVSDLDAFGKKVWLKLLSTEKYAYSLEAKSKPAHLSAAFGMQFDQQLLNFPDSQTVVQLLSEWIKPFSSYEAAEQFAAKTFPSSITVSKEEAKMMNEKKKENEKINHR